MKSNSKERACVGAGKFLVWLVLDLSRRLILSFYIFFQGAIVSRFTDEIGSVDCNQAAHHLYLQPVFGLAH